MREIDELIDENNRNTREPFLIDVSLAKIIIDKINETYEFEEPYGWDIKAFKASMEYLSNSVEAPERKGRIWCLLRKGREISRCKPSDGTLSNQPDNPETDQTVAREFAIDTPMLILTQQVGSEKSGWGGTPFWWPVLWIPKNTQTVVFASDINEV